jgi:hypothetical protein
MDKINIFMIRDQNYLQATWSLRETDQPPPLRAITYDDEAISWSRSNHLMGSDWSPQVMTEMTASPEPFAELQLR